MVRISSVLANAVRSIRSIIRDSLLHSSCNPPSHKSKRTDNKLGYHKQQPIKNLDNLQKGRDDAPC